MRILALKLYIKAQSLKQALKEENGQDLIEYLLIGGIVALGATAGMTTLAANINAAFGTLSTKVASAAATGQ